MVITNLMFIISVAVIVGCFAYTMFELRTARAKLVHLQRTRHILIDEARNDGFRQGYEAGLREHIADRDLS